MTATQLRARRAQDVTLLSALLACLALLVAAQCILLSVAVEGYRGGHLDLVTAAAVASGACCAAACWLLGHVPPARRTDPGTGD